MKTNTLLFPSKNQLFEFYCTLGKVIFAMDVSKLILTSSFSSTDLVIAVKKYDAKVLSVEPSA